MTTLIYLPKSARYSERGVRTRQAHSDTSQSNCPVCSLQSVCTVFLSNNTQNFLQYICSLLFELSWLYNIPVPHGQNFYIVWKSFSFSLSFNFFIWPSPPLFDDPIISFSKRNNNQQLISVHTLHPTYVDCFLLFQTTKPVKSWWQKHWLYSSEGDGLGQREIWKILSLKWRRSDGEWKWIYFYFKEYSCRKIVRMVE